MTEPAPVPPPVHAFFASFLAKPDARGMRMFQIELLDLELRRAKLSLLTDPPLYEPSRWCRSDIAAAQRALKRARQNGARAPEQSDLRHHWLTLLGWRLAFERGFAVGGAVALCPVATRRLNVPLQEVGTWDEETLFRRFTETGLRDEWDYAGTVFRSRGLEEGPEEMDREQRA